MRMRERESARERESTANKDFKLPGTKVLVGGTAEIFRFHFFNLNPAKKRD